MAENSTEKLAEARLLNKFFNEWLTRGDIRLFSQGTISTNDQIEAFAKKFALRVVYRKVDDTLQFKLAYEFEYGPCILCGVPFGYDPLKVPKSAIPTGRDEPVCKDCIEQINLERIEMGMEVIIIDPEAYKSIESIKEKL